MRLNLSKPEGLDVLMELVAWADVVVGNLPSTRMKRMGLTYDELKKVNPSIIFLDTTGFGQTGPMTSIPAWGWNLFAIAGFPSFLGWPDTEPMASPVAYTDYLAPWYGVVAIMAALEHRSKTGKGQFIDLAQNEVNLQHLAPALVDYTVNGVEQSRIGNRSPYGAPHGVYPCRGDDRWCAIAVFTEKEWQAFCHIMGDPDWTKDTRFATLLSRKQNEDELDRLIQEWTITFTAEEVMDKMQSAGVAAGIVRTGAEIIAEDPQIKHRDYMKVLDHHAIGPSLHSSTPGKLMKTPAEVRPAPCLGEHTEYICREILQMPDERFVQLLAEGVFD
jgi:crotonobetainyl-CoA:carnitine CoA-transferase CaiB-like acyl-CoA transferase